MADEKQSSEKPKGLSNEVTDSNLVAALSYLWVLSIVFYILKKDDSFVQFHSKQGMVLFGLSLIGMVPVLGWPLGVVVFVVAVVGALKAYQGEKYRIPFIGDLAEKINF